MVEDQLHMIKNCLSKKDGKKCSTNKIFSNIILVIPFGVIVMFSIWKTISIHIASGKFQLLN